MMLRTACVLAIALLSVPAGAEPPARSAAVPVGAKPSQPASPECPPLLPGATEAAPDPSTPIKCSLRVGLSSSLGFGVAPRADVGMSADVTMYDRVTWLPFFEGASFGVGASWTPPATGNVPGSTKPARLSTYNLLLDVAFCAYRWKLYGCAVLGMAQLRGQSEAIAIPAGGTYSGYVETGPRLGIEVPFAPHLGFRVFGEALGN